MRYEYRDPKLSSIFGYTDHLQKDINRFSIDPRMIKILWNRQTEVVCLFVDDIEILLQPNQIVTLTFFHKLRFPEGQRGLTGLTFNREFYCISDHDHEVGCNGILFFGTQDLPIISLDQEHLRKFDLLIEVILDEFQTRDTIQGDMLQMLLKRFIIICTRLAKEQLIVQSLKDSQIDVIRQFNVLVDIHFRTKRKVKDYAELMHKSAKTLSNLFSVYNQKSPQQLIQERIVLEAKRLLLYTDKQNQEIAYELGFEDPSYFSRYFKKIAHLSPSEYREQNVFTA